MAVIRCYSTQSTYIYLIWSPSATKCMLNFWKKMTKYKMFYKVSNMLLLYGSSTFVACNIPKLLCNLLRLTVWASQISDLSFFILFEIFEFFVRSTRSVLVHIKYNILKFDILMMVLVFCILSDFFWRSQCKKAFGCLFPFTLQKWKMRWYVRVWMKYQLHNRE